MKIAIWSISLLALLQLLLVMNILFQRGRSRRYLGAPDDPANPLFRARLAHSNANEYGPLLGLLMICLEFYGHRIEVMPWLYGSAVAARYFHAIGLVNFDPSRPNVFRALGMVGTLISLMAMIGTLMWLASQGMAPR